MHHENNAQTPVFNGIYILRQYQTHLLYLSAGLFGAAIIYLVASNWFYFPSWLKLSLPQMLLIATSTSLYRHQNSKIPREIFGALSALMLGLSLAAYGQVYQTGADSHMLFLVWSILLLLLMPLKIHTVFTIFCITSMLAIIFTGQQFNLASYIITSIIALTLFILTIVANTFFPKTIHILFVLLSITIVYSTFRIMSDGDIYAIYAYRAVEFILPALLGIYFSLTKKPLFLSVSLFLLSLPITIHATTNMFQYLQVPDRTLYIVVAVLILSLGGIYTLILNQLFYANLLITTLPSAVTRLIATFCLWLFTMQCIPEKQTWLLTIIGIILLSIAVYAMQTTKSPYLRSILYTFAITGYIFFIQGMSFVIDIWQVPIFVLPFALFCILLVSLKFNFHWFLNCLQAITLVCILEATYPTLYPFILGLILLYLLTKKFNYLAYTNLRRTYASALLAYAAISLVIGNISMHLMVSIEIFFVIIYLISLYLSPVTITPKVKLISTIFATALVAFNGLPIILILSTLSLAIIFNDRLLRHLSILALILSLFYEYYSLNSTSVTKSMYMLANSVLFLVFAWGISTNHTKQVANS